MPADNLTVMDGGTSFFGDHVNVDTLDDFLAPINYSVSKRGITFEGSEGRTIDGQVAIARDDTNECLGVVSSRYTPFQNMETLVPPSEVMELLNPSTCGTFKRGSVAWTQFEINRFEPVKGDEVVQRLALTNSHDGSMPFLGGLCVTRIVCENTHMAATHQISSNIADGKGVRLKHTARADDRLRATLDTINGIVAEAAGFSEFAMALANKQCTESQFKGMLDGLSFTRLKADAKRSARKEGLRERLLNMFNGELVGHEFGAGSLWTAYNVFTEEFTHNRGTRVKNSGDLSEGDLNRIATEQRAFSNLYGQSQKDMKEVMQQLHVRIAA